MPDKHAYDLNYYEVFSTPYAFGSGELLMDNIEEWALKNNHTNQ